MNLGKVRDRGTRSPARATRALPGVIGSLTEVIAADIRGSKLKLYANSSRSNSIRNTGHRAVLLGGSARRAALAHAYVHAKFVYRPASFAPSGGSQ